MQKSFGLASWHSYFLILREMVLYKVSYIFEEDTGYIDYDEMGKLYLEHKPKVTIIPGIRVGFL